MLGCIEVEVRLSWGRDNTINIVTDSTVYCLYLMIQRGVITLIIDNKEEHDIVIVDWEKGKACGEYLPGIVTTPTQPQHNLNLVGFDMIPYYTLPAIIKQGVSWAHSYTLSRVFFSDF